MTVNSIDPILSLNSGKRQGRKKPPLSCLPLAKTKTIRRAWSPVDKVAPKDPRGFL